MTDLSDVGSLVCFLVTLSNVNLSE